MEQGARVVPGIPGPHRPTALGGRHRVLEHRHEGMEDASQLVGMGLGEPQVLTHEGGGIGQASLDGEEPEQSHDHDS